MKTTRFLIATVALVALSTVDAEAQGFLDRLGRAAGRAAENAVTRQAERRTEEAINKTIDGVLDGNGQQQQQQQQQVEAPATASAPAATEAQAPAAQAPQQSLEMTYAKNDFVPGDEIMFEDTQAGEQLGEFPSMWDMISGNVEVANVGGQNAIALFKSASITPLMKTPKEYLPESFTIELDAYIGPTEEKSNTYVNGNFRFDINSGNSRIARIFFWGYARDRKLEVNVDVRSTSGENRSIYDNVPNIGEGWHHLAISFNKRALKVYIDGYRVANAPNVAQGTWFSIETGQNGGKEATFWVKNVRIAKGAVPLYDRMMSDGKFITYGITFDVGKSTIKPESMGEINRIVQLMTENPELKFSVEGHTDSTGNAASNQTLSDARSAAVVAKLVELGIAADRLTSAGKGQNSPIADNSTDEGRAKNRRVEFVKI
jgi:outer membrane protein OmpA-like peptidoglycan-associated protein